MRSLTILFASLFLISGSGAGLQSAPVPRLAQGLEVIEAQLTAFNAHDVAALAANLAEDFVWYAVDRDRASVELQGRDAFRRSMDAYFAAFPEARAEIDAGLGGGVFIAVRERAFWRDDEGAEASQASLAVYEVHEGLIHSVWYYPVEPYPQRKRRGDGR